MRTLARGCVKLGSQRRDAQWLTLGRDDNQRTQLQTDANARPQDERDKLMQEAY